MKPEQYEDAAQRIIDDDGAAGVALLMADHTRLLEQLRAIYDEGSPRQVESRGAEETVATMRDIALNGLKMPSDLRDRLRASGRPALTENDDIEVEVAGEDAMFDWRVRVHVSQIGRPGAVRDIELSGTLQSGTGAGPGMFGLEACCRAIFGAASQVTIHGEHWGRLDPMAALLQRVGSEPIVEEAAEKRCETEESAEDAARRLAGELDAERSRVAALEETGAELVTALTEGPMPTPWWLRAANALNELHRLAVDKDGV